MSRMGIDKIPFYEERGEETKSLRRRWRELRETRDGPLAASRRPVSDEVAMTADMIFNVAELIAHITSFMTLLPGDVVWSGTPPSRTPVKVGDVIEAEIEGIGILRNEVLAPR